MNVIEEIMRRNVVRAAALHVASASLLVQVITQFGPVFDQPASTQRRVIIALLIGLPFAVLFSWFHEWTPRGTQHGSEIEQDESDDPLRAEPRFMALMQKVGFVKALPAAAATLAAAGMP